MISTNELLASVGSVGSERGGVTGAQVVGYLWAVVERFRGRGEGNSIECILCEEKLIHLAVVVEGEWGFRIQEEVVGFVQKVNRLAMEGVKEGGGNVKLMAKAVDVVMLPQLEGKIEHPTPLIKLRILTFNNLACILKRSHHLQMALRAVTYAINLEQTLTVPDDQKYDIIPTYLNRAAILSDLGRHDRALDQIRLARTLIDRISLPLSQPNPSATPQQQRRLQQKRHYGLYMKMLISYNTGVQKEHQRLMASAVGYYSEGKRLALEMGNGFMVGRLEEVIREIKAGRK